MWVPLPVDVVSNGPIKEGQRLLKGGNDGEDSDFPIGGDLIETNFGFDQCTTPGFPDPAGDLLTPEGDTKAKAEHLLMDLGVDPGGDDEFGAVIVFRPSHLPAAAFGISRDLIEMRVIHQASSSRLLTAHMWHW